MDLTHFVKRTAMYIHPIERNTLVNFIYGYEQGIEKNIISIELRKILTENYKIYSSSDGWPGQIDRLSAKLNLSWSETFNKIMFELIELGRIK